MEFNFDLQLFGGGGGGGSAPEVKNSAPGANQVATGAENISTATRKKFKDAMNRRATDKTANSVQMSGGDNSLAGQIKKAFLGE